MYIVLYIKHIYSKPFTYMEYKTKFNYSRINNNKIEMKDTAKLKRHNK